MWFVICLNWGRTHFEDSNKRHYFVTIIQPFHCCSRSSLLNFDSHSTDQVKKRKRKEKGEHTRETVYTGWPKPVPIIVNQADPHRPPTLTLLSPLPFANHQEKQPRCSHIAVVRISNQIATPIDQFPLLPW